MTLKSSIFLSDNNLQVCILEQLKKGKKYCFDSNLVQFQHLQKIERAGKKSKEILALEGKYIFLDLKYRKYQHKKTLVLDYKIVIFKITFLTTSLILAQPHLFNKQDNLGKKTTAGE